MQKNITSILSFVLIAFSLVYCKKQNTNIILETETEAIEAYQFDEPFFRHSGNLPSIPPGLYYHRTGDIFAPDGKMVSVYNREVSETPWGLYYDAPVIYLYDKDNNVIATYDILDLVSENFLGGDIIITYNKERNSFDMVFSLDAYGNYGTAYIDLGTNQFIRELKRIERNTKNNEDEMQGMPADYVEGSNLGLIKNDYQMPETN
jgi:hypothetical protein